MISEFLGIIPVTAPKVKSMSGNILNDTSRPNVGSWNTFLIENSSGVFSPRNTIWARNVNPRVVVFIRYNTDGGTGFSGGIIVSHVSHAKGFSRVSLPMRTHDW